MSFSVNQGSTTVYTLPNDSGVSGAVLTSGGFGATASWAILSSGRMYGEVIMLWMLTKNFSTNNGGKSPSINGSVESDWYLCDGSTITTNSSVIVTVPDMIGRVSVGAKFDQNVATGGTYEITAAIPTPSHTHTYSRCQGQWEGTTGDGGKHNHGHTIGADFNNKRRTNVENSSKDKEVVVQIDGINISGAIQETDNHRHNVEVSMGHSDNTTSAASSSVSAPIFKHYKLYYIIYLP